MSVVVSMTGLSERQIRYYESKGLLKPDRTRGNRRMYSQEDVDRLREIKALLQVGYTLGEVPAALTRRAQSQARQPHRGDAAIKFPGAGSGQPARRITSLYPPAGGFQLIDAVDEARSKAARSKDVISIGEGRGKA
ncbi:MAG: MerR family transcriptional regulator [Firmicutes bacterium]|nr:MerR family transcriptional regulator [Bacillota bacterium]